MNARTLVLIFAVALIGVGLLMTVRGMLSGPAPVTQITVARANTQIEPQTLLTQDMFSTEQMNARDAQDVGAWRYDLVPGKIAMGIISPGDLLTASNVLPPDQGRGDTVYDEELVSFQASVDRMVAGQLKPGQLINVYGTKNGGPKDTYTALIEPNVRIVRVQAAGGQPAGQGTPEVDNNINGITYSGDTQPRTGTLLVVALPPEKAYHLIDALGAQQMTPWVTVAANSIYPGSLATPVAVGQSPELPDISATLTAIASAIAGTPPVAPPVTGGGGTSR